MRISAFGDCITNVGIINIVGWCRCLVVEDQWPNRLQQLLGSLDGGATTVTNYGLMGKTVWDYNRTVEYRAGLATAPRADASVFMFGTNDANDWDELRFTVHYESIIRALVRPGSRCVLMVPPPVYQPTFKRADDILVTHTLLLPAIAAVGAATGCEVLDHQPRFLRCDPVGAGMCAKEFRVDGFDGPDGVHPAARNQLLMAGTLAFHLEPSRFERHNESCALPELPSNWLLCPMHQAILGGVALGLGLLACCARVAFRRRRRRKALLAGRSTARASGKCAELCSATAFSSYS